MANPYFQFKMFTIRHDRCAMKVGTDGVLLGAWADTSQCTNILDVGTGTGLIALMLAQRESAHIDAIDIDADACHQAKENVAASPFAERICVCNQPLAEYAALSPTRYELIVSNPPYFAQSLKCPDVQRSLARHNDTLSLSSLIADSLRLLAPTGRIALVLPSDRESELSSILACHRLHMVRRTDVVPTPEASPKRLLAELSAVPATCRADTLTIEEARHRYTPEYIALTRDFYLNM